MPALRSALRAPAPHALKAKSAILSTLLVVLSALALTYSTGASAAPAAAGAYSFPAWAAPGALPTRRPEAAGEAVSDRVAASSRSLLLLPLANTTMRYYLSPYAGCPAGWTSLGDVSFLIYTSDLYTSNNTLGFPPTGADNIVPPVFTWVGAQLCTGDVTPESGPPPPGLYKFGAKKVVGDELGAIFLVRPPTPNIQWPAGFIDNPDIANWADWKIVSSYLIPASTPYAVGYSVQPTRGGPRTGIDSLLLGLRRRPDNNMSEIFANGDRTWEDWAWFHPPIVFDRIVPATTSPPAATGEWMMGSDGTGAVAAIRCTASSPACVVSARSLARCWQRQRQHTCGWHTHLIFTLLSV